MTVVKQVYFCQSEELKKKKTIYIERRRRGNTSTRTIQSYENVQGARKRESTSKCNRLYRTDGNHLSIVAGEVTVVKQVYFCQSEELKNKKTIYIERRRRGNTSVEVQSFVLYRWDGLLVVS